MIPPMLDRRGRGRLEARVEEESALSDRAGRGIASPAARRPARRFQHLCKAARRGRPAATWAPDPPLAGFPLPAQVGLARPLWARRRALAATGSGATGFGAAVVAGLSAGDALGVPDDDPGSSFERNHTIAASNVTNSPAASRARRFCIERVDRPAASGVAHGPIERRGGDLRLILSGGSSDFCRGCCTREHRPPPPEAAVNVRGRRGLLARQRRWTGPVVGGWCRWPVHQSAIPLAAQKSSRFFRLVATKG